MLTAVMTIGVVSMANADQGSGKVTFTGTIIDAPCSISPDSIDQTIPLGGISSAVLQNGGKSEPRPFTIDLENCTFGSPATKNKVTVTFTGMESSANNGLLGITGTAKGASIAITRGDGELIELSKPTKEQLLQDGNNTLSFAAYLKGDGASVTITEGYFQGVADFTLAYN